MNYDNLNTEQKHHSIKKRNLIKGEDLKDIKWIYFKKNRTAILITKSSQKTKTTMTSLVTTTTTSTITNQIIHSGNLLNNMNNNVNGNAQWLEPFSITLKKDEEESDEEEADLTKTTTSIMSHSQASGEIICEKNLTRIAIFYSSKDELNCDEFQSKESSNMLKCKDDLLESKFIKKLKQFYYVRMEPLLIHKSKMICQKSKKVKHTFDRIYLKELNLLFINNQTNLSKNSRDMASLIIPPPSARVKYVYTSPNKTDYLVCNLKTKNYNVRRRLVWKLYLITKHKSCLSSFTNTSFLSPSPADLIVIENENDLSGELTNYSQSQDTNHNNNFTGNSFYSPTIKITSTKLNTFETYRPANKLPNDTVDYIEDDFSGKHETQKLK